MSLLKAGRPSQPTNHSDRVEKLMEKIDSDKKMHFNVWLPEKLQIAIKKLAADQKKTLTDIAIESLNDYLHKYIND